MSAQDTDKNVVPALIEQALRKITAVGLFSAEFLQIRNPPLGAVGGAGTFVSTTRLVLTLEGITRPQANLLKRNIKGVAKLLYWTINNSLDKRHVLRYSILTSHDPPRLILILWGSIKEPRQLSAAINGKTTIQWRIANTSA